MIINHKRCMKLLSKSDNLNKPVFCLLVMGLCFLNNLHAQNSFSGELIYNIIKVDSIQNPLIPSQDQEQKMIVYSKDSLLKIVNFNSVSGTQEALIHIPLKKTIVLLKLDEKGYAIRMKNNLQKYDESDYQFEKKCGLSAKIGGLKSKKMIMSHPDLKHDLMCYYSKKIDPKYSHCFEHVPGLPTLFFLALEDGLYRYELESHKEYETPISLFMIPEGYEVISFEEFMESDIH